MIPSKDTSIAFMIFNELNETRKKLLTEEDTKTREALNAHFKNIVELHEEQKVNNENSNKNIARGFKGFSSLKLFGRTYGNKFREARRRYRAKRR